MFERLLVPVGRNLPAQIAERDPYALPQAKTKEGIHGLKRIVEKFAVVIDPGKPRTAEKVFSKDFFPHILHFLHLGEEAMSSHVEIESLVIFRAGKPTHFVS